MIDLTRTSLSGCKSRFCAGLPVPRSAPPALFSSQPLAGRDMPALLSEDLAQGPMASRRHERRAFLFRG